MSRTGTYKHRQKPSCFPWSGSSQVEQLRAGIAGDSIAWSIVMTLPSRRRHTGQDGSLTEDISTLVTPSFRYDCSLASAASRRTDQCGFPASKSVSANLYDSVQTESQSPWDLACASFAVAACDRSSIGDGARPFWRVKSDTKAALSPAST